MLRELFEGAGVASALDHARIEAANDPEALQRDQAAARVARRAADALRRSRAACEVRREPWNTVGFFGVTTRPPRA